MGVWMSVVFSPAGLSTGDFRQSSKASDEYPAGFPEMSGIRATIHPKIRYPSGIPGFNWSMRNRWVWLPVLFFLATVGGYWLARTAAPEPDDPVDGRGPSTPHPAIADSPMPEFRRSERTAARRPDAEALAAGAIANERVIAFSSQDALEAFLARAGDGVVLLGRLDALNALRVRFSDPDALAALLNGDEELSMIFPVEIPMPGDVGAQPGAVPLGNGLLT